MKRIFTAKQFTIKSEWCGSRLEGGSDWIYRIYFNAPNGKQIEMKEKFFRKEDAKKYISRLCKLANAMYPDYQRMQEKKGD